MNMPVTQGPLRQVQPELETLLDAAIDGVVLIDHKGRIRLMSQAAEEMFGYREDELLGHNVSELMPDPHRGLHDHYLQRYINNRQPRILGQTRDVTAMRRDGSTFAAEIAVGVVRNIEPPRFIAFIRDISERRQQDLALRRSEAALHMAQELANIGNYVIYLDGTDDDFASPQLRRIFGWSAEEPLQGLLAHILANVHPTDRDRVQETFAAFERSEADIDIEYRTFNRGALRHLHHLAQLIREGDRVVQQVGTVHDVTEQRLADYELRQMHNRIAHFGRISTMGEMATGIAHEVNQPLSAIANYARACKRLFNSGDYSHDELSNALEQIAQQALRAGEVIRRLRAFAKHHDARMEAIDANRLLLELQQLAHIDAHYHNVRLQCEQFIEVLQVCVDAVQLQQVLLNLVRNAIDAMQLLPEEQREITVRLRRDEHGDVEFTVADRGPGISSDVLNEVFTPFYTTKESGTGLGLAISMSIIRAHGGRLWYADNPGGGARFIFSLPLLKA